MSFEFIADVMETGDDLKQFFQAMRELNETEVLVGVPEEKAPRKGDEPTNALLMYWHSNGAPLAGIPPRPVIEPSISDAKDKIGPILGAAAEAAMDGNVAGMTAQFEKAGLAGQRAAQAWFTDSKNGWPALSDATKAARERGARKAYKVKKGASFASNPNPLIDTGELRRSITYVVRKKGGA